jgi:hypothetical protein
MHAAGQTQIQNSEIQTQTVCTEILPRHFSASCYTMLRASIICRAVGSTAETTGHCRQSIRMYEHVYTRACMCAVSGAFSFTALLSIQASMQYVCEVFITRM